jgi:poly-gamma-glutamate capsule biosynthesis protein CapA/YwtB (metallophosphatase superfamily)
MSEKTSISILNQLNIDAVTLANNHILDYGTHGLLDTFDTLKSKEIAYVGAGTNLKDAARYITLNKDGMKIAILNFCENEWSIAKEELPGANPMNLIDNSIQIREAKASHDKVIVIVHGGHEYYNLPSPRMQKQYRFYADQGADFVVGHHTHCISGYEVYNGVPIYYSLGNFLFTSQSTIEDWYIGLVLEVNIENGNLTSQLHPVEQQKETFELSLLNGKKREDIMKRISKYNAIIADEEKLKSEWNNYIDTKYDMYLNYWSPFSFISNRYVRGILNRLGIKGINKKGVALALNLMRCEAHADMSKEVTNKYLKR